MDDKTNIITFRRRRDVIKLKHQTEGNDKHRNFLHLDTPLLFRSIRSITGT